MAASKEKLCHACGCPHCSDCKKPADHTFTAALVVISAIIITSIVTSQAFAQTAARTDVPKGTTAPAGDLPAIRSQLDRIEATVNRIDKTVSSGGTLSAGDERWLKANGTPDQQVEKFPEPKTVPGYLPNDFNAANGAR